MRRLHNFRIFTTKIATTTTSTTATMLPTTETVFTTACTYYPWNQQFILKGLLSYAKRSEIANSNLCDDLETWHRIKSFKAFLEVCSKSESVVQFIVSCRNLFMMPRFRSASNEVITLRPYKVRLLTFSQVLKKWEFLDFYSQLQMR